jgi:hypothetical protein
VTVTIFGAAVSLAAVVVGGADCEGGAISVRNFPDGFVKAFTPTYDREIASRAAMPIPIGLSFRAGANNRLRKERNNLLGFKSPPTKFRIDSFLEYVDAIRVKVFPVNS